VAVSALRIAQGTNLTIDIGHVVGADVARVHFVYGHAPLGVDAV